MEMGRRLDRDEPYAWSCCHDVHWEALLEAMGGVHAIVAGSPYLSHETIHYQMACTEPGATSRLRFLERIRKRDVFGRLAIAPPIQQILHEYKRLASRRRSSHVRLLLAVSY